MSKIEMTWSLETLYRGDKTAISQKSSAQSREIRRSYGVGVKQQQNAFPSRCADIQYKYCYKLSLFVATVVQISVYGEIDW